MTTPSRLSRRRRGEHCSGALRSRSSRCTRWKGRSRRGPRTLCDARRHFETIERDSHIGGGILAGALSYRLFVFALPLAFSSSRASDSWQARSACIPTQSRTRSASPGSSRNRSRVLQGSLELVGRPHLVLRARLRNESPAAGRHDRSLTGVGTLGDLSHPTRDGVVRFRVAAFEHLPLTTANQDLLSLAAQHPNARVKTNPQHAPGK